MTTGERSMKCMVQEMHQRLGIFILDIFRLVHSCMGCTVSTLSRFYPIDAVVNCLQHAKLSLSMLISSKEWTLLGIELHQTPTLSKLVFPLRKEILF